MEPRLDHSRIAPGATKGIATLDAYVKTSGLDAGLVELVKIRASQINGCAYCLDMHTKDALAMGETTQRLFALAAWRETPFFTPRERAALAWTEAVTLVADTRVPDDVYEEARAHFSEKELVDLIVAVAAINAWNRIVVSFRPKVGPYEPRQRHAAPPSP